MQEHFKSGEIVLGRFTIEQLIGRGAFGSVYLAQDQQNGEKCVLKVIPKLVEPTFGEYIKHLKELQNRLSDTRARGIIVPTGIVETESFVYQIFPYIEPGEQSLATVLQEKGVLQPQRALEIVRDVAIALDTIHSKNILHGDIKPTNILIAGDGRVYIIDFGMARRSETEERVAWVGTYKYAHPALKNYVPKRPGTSTAMVQPISHGVGPYVDIYALGIVAIEMLTGDPYVSSTISEVPIKSLLNQRSPYIRLFRDSTVDKLCNLLFRMLAMSPSKASISAGTISSIAAALAEECRVDSILSVRMEHVGAPEEKRSAVMYGGMFKSINRTLERLERVAESLISSTAIMVRTTEQLTNVELTEYDPGMFQEINNVFETARKRIKLSWNIGVLMTIACFVLIFTMTGVAITLSVLRGANVWGLIFGGASISAIIGTLIWHPYDRIFRATILAQQLEIIHIQSLSGLRATQDFNQRAQVFREALEGLQTLLESHARQQVGEKGTRQKK